MARFALLAALALASAGARADTPIVLTQTFAGNVNFTGTQVTIRSRTNTDNACSVYGSDTWRKATLAGIPDGATVLGAHLYWAGSGYTPDYTVTSYTAATGSETVAAATDRRYYSYAGGDGSQYNTNYFGGAADVTEQVRRQRNGDYYFKGLTVQSGSPYCSVQGVVGGFSLLVVYSHADEPFRVLNLYEGFQFIHNSSFTLNVSNFRIPADDSGGRIAHVTWEGDGTLNQGGEKLVFNGTELNDATNPAGNQFNSKSSINGDGASHGIDFDAYTLGRDLLSAGATSATTLYQSGQDLVLLNAEVVAVPNSPAADLGITKVRNNPMTVGQNVSYTITVLNSGPYKATGVTGVSDNLPTGLTYVSAGGSGWSCSGGQSISCTTTAEVAVGASLPPITVTARVDAAGTYTNTATVAGALFDHNASNNIGTAAGSAAAAHGTGFVFTDSACVYGRAFGSPLQTCSPALPGLAAGSGGQVFITYVEDGVPSRLHRTQERLVPMQFGLSCHNPASNAAVRASLGSVTLPLCAANGNAPAQWSDARSARFPAGEPSAETTFRYNDVGQVQLYLKADADNPVSGGVPFVSFPAEIRLTKTDGSDFAALPATDNGPAFVRAGAPFALSAGSYTVDGQLTPNFGRETEPVTFAVPAVSPGAVTSAARAAMTSFPALQGGFESTSGGRATGTAFSWPEVGIITLTPALRSVTYLGAPVAARNTVLGRFIPDRLATATTPLMDCAPNMECGADLAGAAYSGQPFEVVVTARNVTGGLTVNYHGPFARTSGLTAFDAPGGSTANPGAGTLAGQTLATATGFIAGKAKVIPLYTLPNPFVHTAPQARNWTAPTSVYVRARELAGDGVTSLRASGSEEGGIRVVSGRLMVPNASGSERLGLPLKLDAQYWTGSAWETSLTDSVTAIDPAPARVTFSNCTDGLNLGGACRTAALSLQPQAVQKMAGGTMTYTLKPPGYSGSADLVINQHTWLPSTRGRLRFGVHKSPLIYLREVY